MKIPGSSRRHDFDRSRTIVIGLVVVLFCITMGTALGASDEGQGSKGWAATDTYRVMNFIVLLIALVCLLRKPISQALGARIKGIKDQLESLDAQKAAAEKRLAEYNEKLSQLETEAEKIVAEYIKQGNEARAKILKEAEASAEKLQAQARRNIEHEFGKAKQKLQQEIVEKSLNKAEAILKKEITDQDQDRLVDEYIDKVVA
jgi:F-type H+-transporting ATPase subunit b